MRNSVSPLRYPGGKAAFSPLLFQIFDDNSMHGVTYVEPFCGGAAAGLNLLYGGYVGTAIINDSDPAIHAFWWSVLNRTDELCELIDTTPITIAEYHEQKDIFVKCDKRSRLKLGFATLFLNRCNRSGIIGSAGPIGGYKQAGKWKLDVRFNRDELCRRVQKISRFRTQIELESCDGISLLQRISRRKQPYFAFIDPPYVEQGDRLYNSDFDNRKHSRLAKVLEKANFQWLLTYDDAPLIRSLYPNHTRVGVRYSAQIKTLGSELLVHSQNILLPDFIQAT